MKSQFQLKLASNLCSLLSESGLRDNVRGKHNGQRLGTLMFLLVLTAPGRSVVESLEHQDIKK